MTIKLKKHIIRTAGVAVLLLTLFVVYEIGLLHHVAFKIARAANIEWGLSSPQNITIYFPRWACGEAQPPYLLVETDGIDSASLVGTHIRIQNDDALEFDESYFAECRGRFKSSLDMLIWEHEVMHVEGWYSRGQTVTGRFFDAESCKATVPALGQSLKADELMKAYMEE